MISVGVLACGGISESTNGRGVQRWMNELSCTVHGSGQSARDLINDIT